MQPAENLRIQQTIIPHYRVPLFDLIEKMISGRLIVHSGESCFATSLNHSAKKKTYWKCAKNHFFFRKRLLWQTRTIELCVTNDHLVLNSNIRILSNWVVLLARFLLCKKSRTHLWGHVSGKSNSRFISLARKVQYCLATTFIAYTHNQAEKLAANSQIRTLAAPNACLHKKQCIPSVNNGKTNNNIIYVGRLIKEKKVDFLVRTFRDAIDNDQLPIDIELYIVGTGPLDEQIRSILKDSAAEKRCHLLGHVDDVDRLRSIYNRSFVSISPGYAGLSVTQSLAFGIPIIISKNEPHSPEIEACVENENSSFFESDNKASLVSAILTVHRDKIKWLQKREPISKHIRENYSFESMVSAFIQLVRIKENEHTS